MGKQMFVPKIVQTVSLVDAVLLMFSSPFVAPTSSTATFSTAWNASEAENEEFVFFVWIQLVSQTWQPAGCSFGVWRGGEGADKQTSALFKAWTAGPGAEHLQLHLLQIQEKKSIFVAFLLDLCICLSV